MAYNTDTTGNAGSADKLKTARTVQVDLGATASASFDGTANITAGVTGSLPLTSLASSTSTALGVGQIELGHATDTTVTRSAAGKVAVEGVDLVDLSSTQTLSGKTYISAKATTVTSGGTLTMTSTDAPVQIFTGTQGHVLKLPSTGVIAGQCYTIINTSSGASGIGVQSSSGASLPNGAAASGILVCMARIDAPTASTDWSIISLPLSVGGNPNTTATRDSNGWLVGYGVRQSVSSTATSAGTLTLTVNYPGIILFTGTTTHTCVLPTTSISLGQQYTIINNSTGAVTVNASGGATVLTLPGGTSAVFVALQATPTTAAHWSTMTVPVANITASTTAALGVGSIELGHASDTTLTRSSAGILAVEGIVIPTATDVLGNELDSGESTFNRFLSSGSTSLTNGLLRLSFFTARKTETIASVRLTAAVAQAGATLVRVGIYSVDGSGNLTLVASTESDTTLLSAVQSYTKALSSSWSKTRGTRYAAGVLVVGSTTTGSVGAHVNGSGDSAIAPRISAAISGQTDLPASINSGSLAATTGLPYIAFIP